MTPDELEFLIAQYADGTLEAERALEVEVLLGQDSALVASVESYRKVDQVLAGLANQQPTPEIAWDRLQAKISSRVSDLSAGVVEHSEDLEEKISRLADGSLDSAERVRVESKLALDPSLRILLAQYGSLETVLEGVRSSPIPAVRWERFAAHVSSTIDASSQHSDSIKLFVGLRGSDPEQTGVWGRIGKWAHEPRWVAAAACILVAGSISFRLLTGNSTGTVGPSPITGLIDGKGTAFATMPPPVTPPVASILSVKGPGSDTDITGPARAEVQYGPPTNEAGRSVLAEAMRGESSRRQSRSIVASDKSNVQDKETSTLFPK